MAGVVERIADYGEEDALVKSFLPTLFDSDSDAEETFLVSGIEDGSLLSRSPSQKALHVHLGRPMKKTTSSEAFSKVQAYYKRNSMDSTPSVKEEQPEASSPSSQGISNTSSQTPFSGSLDSSDSLDSSSPFYSVLSFESSDSIFDFDLVSDQPLKRQKVETSAILRQPSPSLTPTSSFSFRAEPCSIVTAQSAPAPAKLAPALLPRHSLPTHSSLPFVCGGVSTGIPVDSCSPELGKTWTAPQAMIPTRPSTAYYPGHYGSHLPSNLPAPVISSEKIAAALMEVKQAPLMASPLGLKLDKVGLASGLQALGLILKD